jgi:hypothetical protein
MFAPSGVIASSVALYPIADASSSGVKEVGPQHPPPDEGPQQDAPCAGCWSADHDPAVAIRP